MQYELYIDVFFLENFMMDYILLMLLKKMLSCTATHGRIVLGALVGALLTCIVIMLPIPYAFAKLLLFHGFINILMLRIGLKIEWDRSFLKAFLFLYIGGFLVGGIIGFLSQYMRIGSLFFVLALLGYYLSTGIWSLIDALTRHNETHCIAILYQGEKSCQARALIDTGNRLKDDLTGKPVSILKPETAELLGYLSVPEDDTKVRYISYHSIGNAAGVLPLFEIDRICLTKKGRKIEISHPLFAVCKDEMDSDNYELILNPDIYIGGNRKI